MIAVVVIVAVIAIVLIKRRKKRHDVVPVPRRTGSLARRVPDSPIALVAAREVEQRLRGRTFRVATVAMLMAITAAIVIPTLRSGEPDHQKIGLFHFGGDRDRIAIVELGRQLGSTVDLIKEHSSDHGLADLRSGQVDILVIGKRRVVVEHALRDNDATDKAQLTRALAVLLAEQHAFAAAHLTPKQETAVRHIEPVPIIGISATKSTGAEQGTAVIGLILLFILLSQYGTWTLIGVMEEKASRIVEVLLAAVRPTQLLAGKVIGIGILVFLQATILVGFALGLSAAVGSAALQGTAPSVVLATLAWVILGYALYSWVFAAAGSMVERQDQIQAIAFPITIPLFVGYISAVSAIASSHASTYIVTLAYVPLTAPFAMPVLVSLHAVTWWQFALSAATSLATTVALARLSGTVYRRSVLRTGSRVRLREALSRARTRSPGRPPANPA